MEAGWVLTDEGEVDCDLYSTMDTLECDYLVIGAGTRGMAFVDGLLNLNRTCKVIVADKRGSPGGQWHDAPSFFRVAQTSSHYGVPSRKLEIDRRKQPPSEATTEPERASKAQVLSYYDSVMEGYVRNGRVRFFPFCTVSEDGTEMTSQMGSSWRIQVKEKVVDASWMEWPMPKAREPPFKVHPDARVVPPNDLGSHKAESYMVIGGGRMGVDTILHLLELGVPPSRVYWVVPRDLWYINREIFYPDNFVDFQNDFEESLKRTNTLEEAYYVFEKKGVVYRLNRKIFPPIIHGTWISPTDIVKLRRIDNANNVIRMGHVREISASYIVLDEGMYPTSQGVLHVDCTSSAIRNAKTPVPIWTERRIRLQQVTQATCGHGEWSVPMSAAVIGYREATCKDIAENNALCTPTNWPDHIDMWQRIHAEFYKTIDEFMEDTKIQWRMVRMRPSVFAVLSGNELARFAHDRAGDTNMAKYHQSLRLADSWRRTEPPKVPVKLAYCRTAATQTADTGEDQQEGVLGLQQQGVLATSSPCRNSGIPTVPRPMLTTAAQTW